MAFERKDHYYRKAKREGKASRAVYKFAELQKRFKLVRKGDRILDLGCAPGGWLEELAALVGPAGKAIGIDLLPLKIHVPRNAGFVQRDLADESSQKKIAELAGGRVDAVLSDMSPNLSGIAFADTYRSYELAMLALDVCKNLLKSGGSFVVKIFPGDEFPGYIETLRASFTKVSTVTPEATRKTSSERYIVAKGYK
ncbi:MAG: RlmE family RNA methyltransferase [Pseudomonadota bacterium]